MRSEARPFRAIDADVIVRATSRVRPGDSGDLGAAGQRQGVMTDPRDYKLDLSSTNGANDARAGSRGAQTGAPRPYLSVHFKCCNAYSRVYRNIDGTRLRKADARAAPRTVTFGVGKKRNGSAYVSS